MITYVKGNLLDATQGIIIHQVNCQGVMGSGVVMSNVIKVCEVKLSSVDFHDKVFLPKNVKLKDLPNPFKRKIWKSYAKGWKESTGESLTKSEVYSVLRDRTYTVVYNDRNNFDILETEKE